MRPGVLGGEPDIEALIVDRYLESLLARRPADPDGVAADLRATAERLTAELPRHHPSFRFEEALAARLAAVANRIQAGELVDLPMSRDDRERDDHAGLTRPVVIGGVITSAALSIAGAAFVAWRRSHPPLAPMSRAVRAVARTRLV
ncbi:MAG: hypothetical protein ACSLFN_03305 [Candidatus Limnocylindrales bacterium]